MRVAFLFSGSRREQLRSAERGEDTGAGLSGLVHLRHEGIATELIELEDIFPARFARFLRLTCLGVHAQHIPLLPLLFRYDVVYTSGAFTTQLILTLLKTVFRFKQPRWVMHDFSIVGLMGDQKTLRQRIFAWMVGRADGIVTIGERERILLLDRLPFMREKVRTIPFGNDLAYFAPRTEIAEERMVLAVGIDPDRDWETFFKACDGIGARVVLIGDPRRHARFDPPPFVEAFRNLSFSALREYYARASVVCLPLDTSRGNNDAMGSTTLFEAMAMGKAIVASETHHMASHLMHGENGILVPQKDASALRAAILSLLNSAQERARLGRAARAYAEVHLDIRKNAKTLAAFFRDVCTQ